MLLFIFFAGGNEMFESSTGECCSGTWILNHQQTCCNGTAYDLQDGMSHVVFIVNTGSEQKWKHKALLIRTKSSQWYTCVFKFNQLKIKLKICSNNDHKIFSPYALSQCWDKCRSWYQHESQGPCNSRANGARAPTLFAVIMFQVTEVKECEKRR